MPAWKRILCAAAFMVGGGGAAAWGVYDVVVWIVSLHHGQRVIETTSFMFGLPLLGVGLCAIGPEFFVPKALATWSDRARTWMAGLVLGSILVGLVLVFLGQPVITVTMEMESFHACDIQGRGRYVAVSWVQGDAACQGRDPVR